MLKYRHLDDVLFKYMKMLSSKNDQHIQSTHFLEAFINARSQNRKEEENEAVLSVLELF